MGDVAFLMTANSRCPSHSPRHHRGDGSSLWNLVSFSRQKVARWTPDSLPVVGKVLSKLSEPLRVNTSRSPTFPRRAGTLGPEVTCYQEAVTWVSVEGQTNAAGCGLQAGTCNVQSLFCCLRGILKNDTTGRAGDACHLSEA